MQMRDYTLLLAALAEAYTSHAPQSASLNRKALQYLVDGGSHTLRLIQPFPPRITSARGAWCTDEDGHSILDFWQGHLGNILGHNPEIVTTTLAQAFREGFGLQTGLTDRLQVEVAEILCQRTGAERVRFTTSGSLATMYAILLARAFTGRDLVMKVGGGWHGAQPWGLKGVGYQDGYHQVLPGSSLFKVHFPYRDDIEVCEPDRAFDPAVCDVVLGNRVLELALLLEDVHMIHSHGAVCTAHTEDDLSFLDQACRRAARRIRASW
jgi:glutamate-1-semialdehyde aminotransferase